MNERIIYLSGYESIEEIIRIVEDVKADSIFLLFPKKSWIFNQTIDLTQLRDFGEKNKKEIAIITTNAIAREKIENIGIKTFACLEENEKTPFEEAKQRIQPNITPSIQNITIDPLIHKKSNRLEQTNKEKTPSFFSRPALHALILLACSASFLFLFIISITIPDAVVYISPAKKEEELPINIKMLSSLEYNESDLWRESYAIFMTPIEKNFEVSLKYTNISKKFVGENATGKAKITNPFNEDYTFKKGTRLESKTGQVYILSDWINIPKKSSVEVQIEARERDNNGKFQGERANIQTIGKNMVIPGLPEEIRKEFSVENTTPILGGQNEWIRSITKKDIQKAKEEIEKKAKIEAEEHLLYMQKKRQEQIGKEVSMLPTSGRQLEFTVDEILLNAPEEGLLGKEAEFFTITAKARVKNFTYLKENLLSVMTEKFKKQAPEGMELLQIDENVLVPQIHSFSSDKKLIKVSFSTRGVYQFIIEPKGEKGFQFVSNIRESVAGKNKEQAENMLINNFPEVSDTHIELWPFWVQKVPVLSESIDLKIMED